MQSAMQPEQVPAAAPPGDAAAARIPACEAPAAGSNAMQQAVQNTLAAAAPSASAGPAGSGRLLDPMLTAAAENAATAVSGKPPQQQCLEPNATSSLLCQQQQGQPGTVSSPVLPAGMGSSRQLAVPLTAERMRQLLSKFKRQPATGSNAHPLSQQLQQQQGQIPSLFVTPGSSNPDIQQQQLGPTSHPVAAAAAEGIIRYRPPAAVGTFSQQAHSPAAAGGAQPGSGTRHAAAAPAPPGADDAAAVAAGCAAPGPDVLEGAAALMSMSMSASGRAGSGPGLDEAVAAAAASLGLQLGSGSGGSSGGCGAAASSGGLARSPSNSAQLRGSINSTQQQPQMQQQQHLAAPGIGQQPQRTNMPGPISPRQQQQQQQQQRVGRKVWRRPPLHRQQQQQQQSSVSQAQASGSAASPFSSPFALQASNAASAAARITSPFAALAQFQPTTADEEGSNADNRPPAPAAAATPTTGAVPGAAGGGGAGGVPVPEGASNAAADPAANTPAGCITAAAGEAAQDAVQLHDQDGASVDAAAHPAAKKKRTDNTQHLEAAAETAAAPSGPQSPAAIRPDMQVAHNAQHQQVPPTAQGAALGSGAGSPLSLPPLADLHLTPAAAAAAAPPGTAALHSHQRAVSVSGLSGSGGRPGSPGLHHQLPMLQSARMASNTSLLQQGTLAARAADQQVQQQQQYHTAAMRQAGAVASGNQPRAAPVMPSTPFREADDADMVQPHQTQQQHQQAAQELQTQQPAVQQVKTSGANAASAATQQQQQQAAAVHRSLLCQPRSLAPSSSTTTGSGQHNPDFPAAAGPDASPAGAGAVPDAAAAAGAAASRPPASPARSSLSGASLVEGCGGAARTAHLNRLKRSRSSQLPAGTAAAARAAVLEAAAGGPDPAPAGAATPRPSKLARHGSAGPLTSPTTAGGISSASRSAVRRSRSSFNTQTLERLAADAQRLLLRTDQDLQLLAAQQQATAACWHQNAAAADGDGGGDGGRTAAGNRHLFQAHLMLRTPFGRAGSGGDVLTGMRWAEVGASATRPNPAAVQVAGSSRGPTVAGEAERLTSAAGLGQPEASRTLLPDVSGSGRAVSADLALLLRLLDPGQARREGPRQSQAPAAVAVAAPAATAATASVAQHHHAGQPQGQQHWQQGHHQPAAAAQQAAAPGTAGPSGRLMTAARSASLPLSPAGGAGAMGSRRASTAYAELTALAAAAAAVVSGEGLPAGGARLGRAGSGRLTHTASGGGNSL